MSTVRAGCTSTWNSRASVTRRTADRACACRTLSAVPVAPAGIPSDTAHRRRETLMDHVRAQLEEDGVIPAGLGPLRVAVGPMRRHGSCCECRVSCRVLCGTFHVVLRRAILVIACDALIPRGSACCWSRRALRSTASTSSCTSRATQSSTTMCRWDFSLPGCSRGPSLSQLLD